MHSIDESHVVVLQTQASYGPDKENNKLWAATWSSAAYHV